MTPRIAAAAAALALFSAAGSALALAAPAPAAPAPAAPAPTTPAPAAPSASATPMALNLAQAEDIALASSPALALARGQLLQAQGGVNVARSSGLPNLGVSGSSTRIRSSSTNTSGTSGSGSGGGTMYFTSNSVAASLRQLLVDGGRVHAAVEAARLTSDASQYALQRQVQNLEFNVAQGYYAALQARHQLQVAKDSLNLAQVQYRLVDAQYKAGVASRADVLTAQLPVAQAQLAVAQAQNGEQTQLASLLDTMGLSAQTPISIADESAGSTTVPGIDEVLNAAQRQRPDLLGAQASFDSAGANLRAARLGLFPTFSGVASAGTQSIKAAGVTSGAPTYSAGVSLSIPLFDGGLTRAQTTVAQGLLDQASANFKTTQLLVSLNVQQAYLALQTAVAGLTAAEAEYSQARTVLDVTNAQYKSGVTTLPLLLNAQVGLVKAESDRVNAIYTYKTDWQQLLLAEGIIGH